MTPLGLPGARPGARLGELSGSFCRVLVSWLVVLVDVYFKL
jgi:hypothetical protein